MPYMNFLDSALSAHEWPRCTTRCIHQSPPAVEGTPKKSLHVEPRFLYGPLLLIRFDGDA
jgi:hypothetical protein